MRIYTRPRPLGTPSNLEGEPFKEFKGLNDLKAPISPISPISLISLISLITPIYVPHRPNIHPTPRTAPFHPKLKNIVKKL